MNLLGLMKASTTPVYVNMYKKPESSTKERLENYCNSKQDLGFFFSLICLFGKDDPMKKS